MSKGWVTHFWTKAAAFFLAVLSAVLLAVCAFSVAVQYGEHWDLNRPFFSTPLCQNLAWQEVYMASENYYYMDSDEFTSWYRQQELPFTNFRLTLYDNAGEILYSDAEENDRLVVSGGPFFDTNIKADGYLTQDLTVKDDFYFANMFYATVCSFSHAAIGTGLASLLVFLFLLLFLSRVSGRHTDGTLAAAWPEKIPFDLYLAILAALFIFGCWIIVEMVESSHFYLPPACLCLLGCIALCAALFLAGWMSLCTRVKLGTWWRNTLIFFLFKLCRKLLRWLLHMLSSVGRSILRFLRQIPLIWKTVLLNLVVWCLVLLSRPIEPGLALLVAVLVSILTCAGAMQLRQLQKGGAVLASGDFSRKIDTRRLYWDFKCHAQHLNSVGDGMSIAVEKQLKSERLKTELITNVSHDIKTPLTSIINYVDLLQRPHTQEQEQEYLAVLQRQSAKLKKLTKDLVEASKASTGNLAVNRSRCSMNELLQQAAGEYSETLADAALQLVTSEPEQPLFCYADGGLMWRMVDNLMSNICKYALSGTRVYLSLEQQEDKAVLTFRNISRAPLNIPEEELMERFVRGDSARSTEGNGLGLSITRSLCELQGGTMALHIDGDLFKVTLQFPLMP